jgi:hypothetical protein
MTASKQKVECLLCSATAHEEQEGQGQKPSHANRPVGWKIDDRGVPEHGERAGTVIARVALECSLSPVPPGWSITESLADHLRAHDMVCTAKGIDVSVPMEVDVSGSI